MSAQPDQPLDPVEALKHIRTIIEAMAERVYGTPADGNDLRDPQHLDKASRHELRWGPTGSNDPTPTWQQLAAHTRHRGHVWRNTVKGLPEHHASPGSDETRRAATVSCTVHADGWAWFLATKGRAVVKAYEVDEASRHNATAPTRAARLPCAALMALG